LEHAPEAIVVFDANTGCFRYGNQNAARLYGYTLAELVRLGPAHCVTQRFDDRVGRRQVRERGDLDPIAAIELGSGTAPKSDAPLPDVAPKFDRHRL